MINDKPTLLALDFDGVLCDGLLEYFQTAWQTYCQLWSVPTGVSPEALAPLFYRTRPVIEIGWEMPVLIRALVLGISETEILQNWSEIAHNIITEEQLQAEIIGPHLDRVRDEWINTDLSGWLGLHRFYPGVIERIKPLIEDNFPVYIITTKEERFVRSLLQEQGVTIPENQLFGKGYKRPKYAILRELFASIEPTPHIWFIEDRLQTLLSVQQQPDLNVETRPILEERETRHGTSLQLFLADWGYNLQPERDLAAESSRINLLSLSQFSQDFSGWLTVE
ncbi:HAD family hydrolase [Planktothrix paucivesiculata]|uniref:Haloacid dehalogenase n=1 Tax=Planktothrix paucivesiculata PCC 9631 TaxID=671071 RepID=A0A7Z9C1I0_9CYAN|nr:HAD family hydrolase [Planktothrix paucivesiculata]VXD23869.1 conserved hypothetical protein [Planktothrix paucivesiculata PCC 9631]